MTVQTRTPKRPRAAARAWLAALLLSLLFGRLSHAAATIAIQQLAWDGSAGRFTIQTAQPITIDHNNLIASQGRFYLDLYNVHGRIDQTFVEHSDDFLKARKYIGYPDQNVLRIVFWTKPGVGYRVTRIANPPRIVVEFTRPASAPAASPVATRTPAPTPTPVAPPPKPAAAARPSPATPPRTPLAPTPEPTPLFPRLTPSSSSKTKKLVIIDPGHGGSESIGARGAVTVNGQRVLEKTVNLQIAKRLAGLIQQAGNMEFMLTRTDDRYVALFDRVQMAEKYAEKMNAQALFVSIHCNWYSRSSPKGIEFYYLSDSDKVANSELARLENDLDLKRDFEKNSMLAKIIGEMERDLLRQRREQSYWLCVTMNRAFRQAAYFRENNRGVKSEKFTVLHNFLMPSILVEVGFMSNPAECKLLMDPQFQETAAKAIYNGANLYFSDLDPEFEGKAYPIR